MRNYSATPFTFDAFVAQDVRVIAKMHSSINRCESRGTPWLRDFLHLHHNHPKVPLGLCNTWICSHGNLAESRQLSPNDREYYTWRGMEKKNFFRRWFPIRGIEKNRSRRIRLPTLTTIIRVANYLNVRIILDTIQYNFPFRLSVWSSRIQPRVLYAGWRL